MFQHSGWDLTHQALFFTFILLNHHMNLRDQSWKMLILWCRELTFLAANFLQKSPRFSSISL